MKRKILFAISIAILMLSIFPMLTVKAAPTEIFSYGFEDWIDFPIGWTVYNVNGENTWERLDSGCRSGDFCVYCSYDGNDYDDNPNDDWLTTEGTVVAAGGDFSVWIYPESNAQYEPDEYEIYMSTTGNTPADFLAGTKLAGVYWPDIPADVYTQYTFSMAAYVGQTVYFAIRYIGNYGYYLYVDDVTFPDGTTEGFEVHQGRWPGWSQEVVSGTSDENIWESVQTGSSPTCSPHGGSWMAYYNSYDADSGDSNRLTYDTSFDFAGEGYNSFTLNFWMYHDTGYSDYIDRVSVCVSTDHAAWSDVETFNRYDGTTGWKQHSVDLSAYGSDSTVYIGFLAISEYGNNMFIDDVEILGEDVNTEVTYTGDTSGQYSDPITLSATLIDLDTDSGIPGETINFTIGSQWVTATTDADGIASTTLVLNQSSGSYTVTAYFAGDAEYSACGDSDPFTINKETVTILYTGDTDVWTAGSVTTAPVRLSASLTQANDGYPGDLDLATVKFVLTNAGTGPSYTVSDVPVNSLGVVLTTKTVAAGSYLVTVTIDPTNLYWIQTEAGMDTLTVTSGSGSKMVTGGGWIPDAESINGKGSFGFTVQYQKRGTPKGHFIYLYRDSDGYNYLVKSNSWTDGGLSFTGTKNAFFTGRCTIQQIDRATGEVVSSLGNYRFTVDLSDGDLNSPRTEDTFALSIWNPTSGATWRQTATTTLGGGNIAIHSK